MRECIEEGILQAYIDNELSPEMAASVAEHLTACAACAAALSEASTETALFASAFEAEMALDIPTVSLRERLDSAIAEMERPAVIDEQKQDGMFTGWLASFAGLFKVSPQRALGFASLIAIITFAAIFALLRMNRSEVSPESVAVVTNDKNSDKTATPPRANPSPTPATEDESEPTPGVKPRKESPGKRNAPKKQANPNLVPEPDQLPKDELAVKTPLPGEENYLKAIDSLMLEIKASDETMMRPSLRAEYERNLAVVDGAIDSTRRAARLHRNDPDAAAFLYSSYQSKLDLLSTVADQVRPTVATR